jgi:hypothetical protein
MTSIFTGLMMCFVTPITGTIPLRLFLKNKFFLFGFFLMFFAVLLLLSSSSSDFYQPTSGDLTVPLLSVS